MFKSIRNFVRGISNIIAYAPILYRDRDFDFEYLLTLLKKKLERMAAHFATANIVVDSEEKAKEIIKLVYGLEDLDSVLFTQEDKLQEIFTEIGKKICGWWD